jgi:hypothetical protein
MILPQKCPKCGGWLDGPRYCRGCKHKGEHLHRKCACGYEVIEPTRDAHVQRGRSHSMRRS